MKLFLPFLLALAVVAGVLSNCKKEIPPRPFTPIITLNQNPLEGGVYDIDTITIAVNAPGGLKSLTITKFIGAVIDTSYGTAGVLTLMQHDYKFIYTFTEQGLKDTIRFNMVAEDSLGQTGAALLVLTTIPSTRYYLQKYDWRLDQLIGQCQIGNDSLYDRIEACEKDNVFKFSPDSSLVVDYGSLSCSGTATCDTDAIKTYVFWHLNRIQTELTVSYIYVPTGQKKYQVYRINAIDSVSMFTSATFDTSICHCKYTGDWNVNFKSQPK